MAAGSMYVYLALFLLVGFQLATSKSVDETFKNARNNAKALSLNKRAANEESKEPESTSELSDSDETTIAPAPISTTAKAPKPRRQPARTKPTPAPTTAAPEDDDDEEPTTPENTGEEALTVEPLKNDKTEKTKKQKKAKPPKTSSPPSVESRLNSDEAPQQQPAAASGGSPPMKVLPPMPYTPPNGFLPGLGPNFAPFGLNNPPPLAGPYDYAHPSGPAFSDAASAFAGASASASASGTGGGTVFTSIGGTPGSQQSSSSSFSGGFPGTQSAGAPAINSRGSFDDDDESVGIEVNGPAPAGTPYGAAGPNYGSLGGPGYSSSASYGPSPYANTIPQPQFGGYGAPYDLQASLQQLFAQIQAQQLAFQRQIEAQIRGGGTFASSSAMITNDQGQVDPNAQVYVNSYTSPNSASASTSIDSRSGFGSIKSSVVAFPFSNKNDTNNSSFIDQNNRIDSNIGAPGGGFGAPANSYGVPAASYGAPGGGFGGSPSAGPQSAVASASLGPRGGFQSAQISPAAPGIFSRFGEEIPAPSGGSFGVFSSSSSSSSVGPDGKQISRKTATVGVNDNGKVSVKTVHDP